MMSAPVLVGVAACAVLLAVPAISGSVYATASAQAAAAADASALAAADTLSGYIAVTGDPAQAPCNLAAAVAKQNRAAVLACEVFPSRGAARVRVQVQIGPFSIVARSHAGAT